uniref:Phytanoyl-CoA dioxygenase n=1 Tax=Magallana gigas TaxID=29159 RepID=K1PPN6_MAGGI
MSISEPPEQGKSRSNFSKPENCWFHLDQGSWRKGLHAYQGAVYLEETTPSDYCFRVLEGSQKYHQDLMYTFSDVNEAMAGKDFYILKNHHLKFYQNKGCAKKKVPVPKGGLVLWDSRLVHDTLAPVEGRPHADRWRFVTYVCMTPAIWASKIDFKVKKMAYEEMLCSAHWPSQGVKLFPGTHEDEPTKHKRIEMVEEQPSIARTRLVQLLAGLEAYDFTDGRPNGPYWEPRWTPR